MEVVGELGGWTCLVSLWTVISLMIYLYMGLGSNSQTFKKIPE